MDESLRMKLLGELIYQLNKTEQPNINHLYAHFYTKRGRLITDDIDVAKAMDCMLNDVWHFEKYNLDIAARVELHVH